MVLSNLRVVFAFSFVSVWMLTACHQWLCDLVPLELVVNGVGMVAWLLVENRGVAELSLLVFVRVGYQSTTIAVLLLLLHHEILLLVTLSCSL